MWAKQSNDFGVRWRIKGFLDDNPAALAGKNVELPIVGRVSDYVPAADDVFVCGVGVPKFRRVIQQGLEGRGGEFINIIHPTAIVGENSALGRGVVICPYAVVSVNTRVDDGVALNIYAMIGHDATIGKWSQISPRCDILGYASLGEEVFLGSHAVVLPGVKIGARAVLGAGAVATRDIQENVTAIGLPAKSR